MRRAGGGGGAGGGGKGRGAGGRGKGGRGKGGRGTGGRGKGAKGSSKGGGNICYKYARDGKCTEPCPDGRRHVCETCGGNHTNADHT